MLELDPRGPAISRLSTSTQLKNACGIINCDLGKLKGIQPQYHGGLIVPAHGSEHVHIGLYSQKRANAKPADPDPLNANQPSVTELFGSAIDTANCDPASGKCPGHHFGHFGVNDGSQGASINERSYTASGP